MLEEQSVRQVPAAPHRRFSLSKRWIFLIFLAIVFLLLFFAFSGSFITGDVIKSRMSNESKGFDIYSEIGKINFPVELKQKIGEITIEVEDVNNKIYLGKNNLLDLSELEKAKISIKNFDGSIFFDGEKIYKLKGDVSKLIINDLPASSEDGKIEIIIYEELSYRSIELKKVYLKKYESIESGKVRINGEKINIDLDEESFLIEGFYGNLKNGIVGNFGIQRKGLILEGSVKNLKIGGDFQINLFK
tara:strand:- start:105 stop:842 length:738 start_codon:yes stop_codon:yes gene_type:complete